MAERDAGRIADMTAGEDPKRLLLEKLNREAVAAGLTDAETVAVAMLAVVLAVRRFAQRDSDGETGVRAIQKRGKIINAACEDFRTKLQRHL